MARTIDIHPVRFNAETHCSLTDTRFSQIVQCGDITQFQMLLDVCPPENNLLLNGDFVEPVLFPWTYSIGSASDWDYNPSAGTMTKLLGSWGAISQVTTVAAGVYVKIVIDVVVTAGAFAILFDGQFYIIQTTGVHEFWATSTGAFDLTILCNSLAEFVINHVSLTPINTNFSVNVIDEDDNVVMTMNSVTDPSYFDFTREFFTFSFDWEGVSGCLPDGCYRLAVSDPCVCGNGGFVASDMITVVNQWRNSAANLWVIVGGMAAYNGGVSSPPAYCYVDGVICPDVAYEVSYTLTNMAGNGFQVKLGGNGNGVVRYADGSYTEVITPTSITGTDAIRLLGWDTAAPTGFLVTDFSFRRVERSFDLISNTFSFMQDAGCTVLIVACENEDNLQSGYNGTGFAPRVRMKGLYGQGYYDDESEEYEYQSGLKEVYYYRGRKVRELKFSAPEYIHDFMRTLRGFAHVFIDNDPVFIESEEYPRPNWKDNWNWGSVTLDVSARIELTEKVQYLTEIATCSVDGQGVGLGVDGGDGDGGVIIGETTEGEILLETG